MDHDIQILEVRRLSTKKKVKLSFVLLSSSPGLFYDYLKINEVYIRFELYRFTSFCAVLVNVIVSGIGLSITIDSLRVFIINKTLSTESAHLSGKHTDSP